MSTRDRSGEPLAGGSAGPDGAPAVVGSGFSGATPVVGSGFGPPAGPGVARGAAPGARRRRIEEIVAAAVFLLVPARLFVGPVGPHRAPGLEGEGLYGQLFAGAVVRRWLGGEGTPGAVDVAGDAAWWPEAPLGAVLQALVPTDAAFALGLVTAVAVWLAGYGPWRLARRVLPAAPVWGAVLAGIAAQTSPVVLRAVPGVELAALGVGPIALGLAHPRLAWIGGLWSLPGAAVFGVAGIVGRRPAWLLAALPALAVLAPASRLPAAMRAETPRAPSVPAYVTDGGAVFPLPPEEQAPIRAVAAGTRTGLWLAPEVEATVRGNLFLEGRGAVSESRSESESISKSISESESESISKPISDSGSISKSMSESGSTSGAPPLAPAAPTAPTAPTAPAAADGGAPAAPRADEARPWIGAVLVPLQRVHGGPVALVGLLALLVLGGRGGAGAWRARGLAVGGLVGVVGLTLVFGWQAAPGEVERDARMAAELLGVLDLDTVAGLPGGGALVWAAFVPAIGALGIAALAGARGPLALRVAGCALLALVGVPLENPRLVAPVASVPPDPVRQTLDALPSDRLVVFPAPQWPYLQGQRPAAAMLWEAAASGQRVEAEGEDAAAAGLIGALTTRSGAPVDTAAARAVWEARGADPVRAAREAGWRYLLVDLDAVPPLGRPRLDGWLAERAGMPVARDGARLVYDLAEGPAGARPRPGGGPPPGGEGASPPMGGPDGGPPPGVPAGGPPPGSAPPK